MIFITLGDPFSINIECLIRTFLNQNFFLTLSKKTQTILIGSYQAWKDQSTMIEKKLPPLQKLNSLEKPTKNGIYFYDLDQEVEYDKNLSRAYRGELSRKSLGQLEKFQLNTEDAVLSCPVDKKLTFCHENSPGGQTEFFEKLSQKKALMTMESPKLMVGLVTNHLPLAKVSQTITKKLVEQKLSLLCQYLQTKQKSPRVAVCSLNPHCGDGGLFGFEDQEIVEPAIKNFLLKNSENRCEVFGPLPADTLFWQAREGQYHGVLALYHDQGLAPMKALYFENTVNVSVGLNFLRVSPAHGPATNLFKQNKAHISGFQEAFRIILNHLKNKNLYEK